MVMMKSGIGEAVVKQAKLVASFAWWALLLLLPDDVDEQNMETCELGSIRKIGSRPVAV